MSNLPGEKFLYKPETYLVNKAIRDRIAVLPLKEQMAIAELISGNIKNHAFYISNQTNTVASIEDLDNIPCRSISGASGHDVMTGRNPWQGHNISPANNGPFFNRNSYAMSIFKHLDGKRTTKEIFDCIREERQDPTITDQALLEDFKPMYRHFSNLDLLVLRHKSVAPYKSFNDMQAPIIRKYQGESPSMEGWDEPGKTQRGPV